MRNRRVSAKSRSVTADVYGDWVNRLGVGLSGLKYAGKILIYGILFNVVLYGVPTIIESLKEPPSYADTWHSRGWQQIARKELSDEPVNPTDPILIYSLLLGWVVVCGFFVQEAKEIG